MQDSTYQTTEDCPDRMTDAEDVEAYVSDLMDPIVGEGEYSLRVQLTRGGALLVEITGATDLARMRAIGRDGVVVSAIRSLLRRAVACRHVEVEVIR